MVRGVRQAYILLFFGILYGIQVFALSPGYITDIKAEHEESYSEVFLFTQPPPAPTNLKDKIFNPELTKEFQKKYIDQFGAVDTDALTYRDPRYAEMADDLRPSIDVEQNSINARRQFGEYMVKRLTEWHVDHYIKEDPQMRPIYEAKEKISHAQVQVNKEIKFDLQYSLAGNTLDIKMINPYLDSKLTMFMDPSAFGPSSNIENKLFLGKDLNKKTRINVTATSNDGIATLELLRKIRGNMSANILESTNFKDQGSSPRETHSAIGFSNSF